MRIEDYIEALNRLRELKGLKGFYVIQKNKEPNPQFKAYKTITYTLWLVVNQNKEKVLTTQATDRIVDSNIEQVEREINISFILELFKMIEDGI